jgi:hypothetical protein
VSEAKLLFWLLKALWVGEIVLAALVLLRLFKLRLQGVYRVFSAFLVLDILVMALSLGTARSLGAYRWFPVDFRTVWLVTRIPYWVLYVWMVYALLQAVMHEYPGVHRLSARVLNGSIAVAAVVGGISTARLRLLYLLGSSRDVYDRVWVVATSLERTASVTSLILLLGVLSFLLWFPVVVPRNLVVFSVTYIVLFASNVVSYSFSAANYKALVWSVLIVACLCYSCWLLFLTAAGERVPSRIGHSWNPADQERLLGQLGAINATLAGVARARQ